MNLTTLGSASASATTAPASFDQTGSRTGVSRRRTATSGVESGTASAAVQSASPLATQTPRN
ncbi:hypothetical protein ABS735_04485 [Streptomyces sp. MMCC 100]|uniref:hypothetical protein n=1 Tax=Streptomyces sp. MMCC 100 TaxID=3163555 RepID=UPI003594F0C7